ncbi:MAG: V-type ATP synthase subunit E family protein [Euryarchaeota archaeon]|nr:V-type ATP synthase subunit E family protein [Euryarchaeota archaeon]
MGLDKVIENIQKEGKEKITSILHNAEMQAAQILQSKQKTIDETAVKKRQEQEKQTNLLKTQEASSVEIEVKKIRLNAEKDILTQTYQECLKALSTLPHEKILSVLLKKAQQELPEAAYVYSNSRDEPIVRTLTNIPYGGSIDTLGGIIVENKEKNLKLDYLYETIAELVWERSLKEIAKKLFI